MIYSKQEQEYLTKIGEKIRLFRIELGISQEKLSFASELDRTYVGSVERGERNISVINLKKLASALKVTPSDLLNF